MTSPIDPITVAVLQHRLDCLTQEMGLVMVRAARSPIFSQAHDFSCFLCDANGQMISQADGIPIHTGSGGFAARAAIRAFAPDIHPEDVFLVNDPYVAGGNHLPDWVVITPSFADGRLLGYACIRAHQADIGGGAAGTYNSQATEIFHEGIRIPPVKLHERGRLRRDLFDLITLNTRCPEIVASDVSAMVGAVRIGAQRLGEIARGIGLDMTPRYFAALLDYAEARMRHELSLVPDGRYEAEETMNNDCFSDRPVRIRVAITVSGSDITVDFTGTDPQIAAFKNSALANTHSAVYIGLATMVDPDIPHNEGTYRMVRIIAPEGSVVNPRPPAPVTYDTVFPAHDIVHCCWKALGQALPDRAPAGWGKAAFPIMTGTGRDGQPYVMYHWGGSSAGGAVKGRDGFDQIGQLISLGGLVLPNLEAAEQLYPVHFVRREFRRDAAGAGEFRGGTGVDYVVRIEEPAVFSLRGEGLRTRSGFGVQGGRDGAEARITIDPGTPAERQLPQYAILTLGPCVFRLESAAGGGWGDPRRRRREAVLRDVADGILSPEAALRDYGVPVEPEGGDDAHGV